MDDRASMIGVWDLDGMPLEIREAGGELLVRLPGAPEGLDPSLRPGTEAGTYVLQCGSFDGAVFAVGPEGVSVGPMTMTRVEGPFEAPPGYGLIDPPFSPDARRDAWFSSVVAGFGDGAPIDWPGEPPKHEFVQWLTRQDRFIFHGSNNRDIDEFRPVRTSMELYDHGDRGNLGAVYGTQYGLWSLFFAVIDRSGIRGSIRNGVTTFEAPDGRSIDSYQFSVDREALPERAFTTGALYILPRDPFHRLPLWPGGPMSNEWASEVSVRPLARLVVEPEDFPFLAEIGAHDDGPLLRMFDLTRALLGSASSAKPIDGGFAIDLRWSEAVAAVYDEWIEIWRQIMPTVTVGLNEAADHRQWTLQGPEAFQETATEWLEELLDA